MRLILCLLLCLLLFSNILRAERHRGILSSKGFKESKGMLLRKDGSGLYGHEKQPGMGQDWVFRVVVPSCVLFHLTDHLIDNFRLYCITFLLGQLPIINRFQFTFTFRLHCFMPSTRQKRKWSIQVNFKQQIDPRLGIYN